MRYIAFIIILTVIVFSCTSNTNSMSTNTNSIKIDEGILHPINGHNVSIQYIAIMDYQDKDGHTQKGMAASLVVSEEGATVIVGKSSTFQLGTATYLVTDVQAAGEEEFDKGFIMIEAS